MTILETDVPTTAPTTRKKGKRKSSGKPRVVKPREYRVQRLIAGSEIDGKNAWADEPHGDEVKDTRSGLEWIKANAQADVAHRIIVVCAQVTKRTKQVAVLE